MSLSPLPAIRPQTTPRTPPSKAQRGHKSNQVPIKTQHQLARQSATRINGNPKTNAKRPLFEAELAPASTSTFTDARKLVCDHESESDESTSDQEQSQKPRSGSEAHEGPHDFTAVFENLVKPSGLQPGTAIVHTSDPNSPLNGLMFNYSATTHCKWDESFHMPLGTDLVYTHEPIPDEHDALRTIPIETTMQGLIDAKMNNGRTIWTRPQDGVGNYNGVVTLFFADADTEDVNMISEKFTTPLSQLYAVASDHCGVPVDKIKIYRTVFDNASEAYVPRDGHAAMRSMADHGITTGCRLMVLTRTQWRADLCRRGRPV